MAKTQLDDDRDGPEVFFDAILTPNRSLSPRGFLAMMALICAVSFTAGLVFFLRGAWPIAGFLGVDVLLIYLLFRANYRAGRRLEHLELTADRLTVRKVNHYGEEEVATFQPYWLNLHIDDPVRHESQITLTSHGKRVVVGSFLSPDERGEFAAALQKALAKARQAPVQIA
jgi:uncharacterized membrane protein